MEKETQKGPIIYCSRCIQQYKHLMEEENLKSLNHNNKKEQLRKHTCPTNYVHNITCINLTGKDRQWYYHRIKSTFHLKPNKIYNRSFTQLVIMPGLLFVKPKPAYKDTKPGIMRINLDP